MVRQVIYTSVAIACAMGIFTNCNNPVSEEEKDTNPTAPSGFTALFSDGFGGDLEKYDKRYMVTESDTFSRMRITTEAAHTGKHSITGDSNRTAIVYNVPQAQRVESGMAGIQFYIMAKAKGQANFTVELGENAGSSGGLGKAFGIGFDPNDSIKCKYFDFQASMFGKEKIADTMLRPIEVNHWYKCVIEVNITDSTVTYYIDNEKIRTQKIYTLIMGIDRALVLRDLKVDRPNYVTADCKEGPQQYYADDIVLYKK
jgi:hypothetical protein